MTLSVKTTIPFLLCEQVHMHNMEQLHAHDCNQNVTGSQGSRDRISHKK